MHKVRRACFFAAIESAMNGGALCVTGLGRNIPKMAREKHRIKRIDRLKSLKSLGSELLGSEGIVGVRGN